MMPYEEHIMGVNFTVKSLEFLSGYSSISVSRHLQIPLLCSGWVQSRQLVRSIHTCSATVRWIGVFLKLSDSVPLVPGLPSVSCMRQMSMLVHCSGYRLNKLLAANIPISSVSVRWIAISWPIKFSYISITLCC